MLNLSGGKNRMKKLFIAGLLVASTLAASAPILAEPLPGGRPPCSILHKTGSGADGPLCTHPAPGT
jgi:hypothetical protein